MGTHFVDKNNEEKGVIYIFCLTKHNLIKMYNFTLFTKLHKLIRVIPIEQSFYLKYKLLVIQNIFYEAYKNSR